MSTIKGHGTLFTNITSTLTVTFLYWFCYLELDDAALRNKILVRASATAAQLTVA